MSPLVWILCQMGLWAVAALPAGVGLTFWVACLAEDKLPVRSRTFLFLAGIPQIAIGITALLWVTNFISGSAS